jgi:hypothetical protein
VIVYWGVGGSRKQSASSGLLDSKYQISNGKHVRSEILHLRF